MYAFRDDPDQQNLIDWIQEGWLQCCGIEGPTVTPFFNQIFWSSKFIIKSNIILESSCSNISLLQQPNFRTGTRTSTSTAAAKLLAHVRPVASHSGFYSGPNFDCLDLDIFVQLLQAKRQWADQEQAVWLWCQETGLCKYLTLPSFTFEKNPILFWW